MEFTNLFIQIARIIIFLFLDEQLCATIKYRFDNSAGV